MFLNKSNNMTQTCTTLISISQFTSHVILSINIHLHQFYPLFYSWLALSLAIILCFFLNFFNPIPLNLTPIFHTFLILNLLFFLLTSITHISNSIQNSIAPSIFSTKYLSHIIFLIHIHQNIKQFYTT